MTQGHYYYYSWRRVHNNITRYIYFYRPTIPYKTFDKMREIWKMLDKTKDVIMKMSPTKGAGVKKLRDLAINFRSKVMNLKGPYAYAYPPGFYDLKYEPIAVVEPIDKDLLKEPLLKGALQPVASRMSQTYVEPPANFSSTLGPPRRDSLIKQSFGYRVTIYRSPHDPTGKPLTNPYGV